MSAKSVPARSPATAVNSGTSLNAAPAPAPPNSWLRDLSTTAAAPATSTLDAMPGPGSMEALGSTVDVAGNGMEAVSWMRGVDAGPLAQALGVGGAVLAGVNHDAVTGKGLDGAGEKIVVGGANLAANLAMGPAAALDWATGGHVAGGAEAAGMAVAALNSGDVDVMAKASDSIRNGDKGFIAEGIGHAGHALGEGAASVFFDLPEEKTGAQLDAEIAFEDQLKGGPQKRAEQRARFQARRQASEARKAEDAAAAKYAADLAADQKAAQERANLEKHFADIDALVHNQLMGGSK